MFLKKHKAIIVFLMIVAAHVFLMYLAIGPFLLYTDSAGYLSTADSLLRSEKMIVNFNRPLGLPLLFYAISVVCRGDLAGIVWFQVIFFVGALLFATRSLMKGCRAVVWGSVFLVALFLSTRTFLYSFMILSESVFVSWWLLFFGFFVRHYHRSDAYQKTFLGMTSPMWGMFFSALMLALTKSIGVVFLPIFFLVLAVEIWKSKRVPMGILVVAGVLCATVIMNHKFLKTYSFSQQDGLQWLISANAYINYDTAYMQEDKDAIKESHQKILSIYAPRTRLDQMVGPMEGVKTPLEILRDRSANHEELNAKMKNIIFDGLFSDGDWYRYLISGFVELYAMIGQDTQEGLINPKALPCLNHEILAWLPYFDAIEANKREIANTPADTYFYTVVQLTMWKKFVLPIVLLIMIVCAAAIGVARKDMMMVGLIATFLFFYEYVSVLMVFALDRYYVGVETILILLISYVFLQTLRKCGEKTRTQYFCCKKEKTDL